MVKFSVAVMMRCLTLSIILGGITLSSIAAQANEVVDIIPRRVIAADPVEQIQNFANISIDTQASTYMPLEPGDISYAGDDLLVSPGLSYVPPAVTSAPVLPVPHEVDSLGDTGSSLVTELSDSSVPSSVAVTGSTPISEPITDVDIVLPRSEPATPVDDVVASIGPAYSVPLSVGEVSETPYYSQSTMIQGAAMGDGCQAQMGGALRTGALNLAAGDLLSDQLGDWVRGFGYTLFWEADQYRAGAPLVLNKPFDETLQTVRDALQQGGINLTVYIYNNCVVRVTEAR